MPTKISDRKRWYELPEEVTEFEDAVRRCLYYPFRTDPDEMTDLEKDEKLSDELFPSGDPHNR